MVLNGGISAANPPSSRVHQLASCTGLCWFLPIRLGFVWLRFPAVRSSLGQPPLGGVCGGLLLCQGFIPMEN